VLGKPVDLPTLLKVIEKLRVNGKV
jgi:hypothetical protein